MTTRVPIRYGGTGANNAPDARTALGVPPLAAYDVANNASSTANAAYGAANSAYGQANDAYAAANTANTNALNAYSQANAAYGQANASYSQANTAYGQANDAYSAANTANTNALNAYSQANAAYGQANTAYGQANDAYAQANAAYNAANNAKVTVYANNASNVTTQNVNFVNTATVTVTVTADGSNANIEFTAAPQTVVNDTYTAAGNTAAAATANIANGLYAISTSAYGQANAAYGQANTAYGQANDAYAAANTANTNALNAYAQANAAYGQANTAYGQANDAYAQANTANTNALNAYAQANAAYGQANTAYGQANDAYAAANTANTNALAAYGQANLAYTQANAAYNQANAAYAEANLKLNLSGGTVSGALNISGNLTVTGNTNYINVSTYLVSDPLIYLAANNDTSDIVDIGFMGAKNTSGVYSHTGLARDASDGKWKLFDGLSEEGHVNNVIDFANTTVGTLVANVEANNITLSGNVVATQANLTLAYNQANTANAQANLAYDQANAAYGQANAAYNAANNAKVTVFANNGSNVTTQNINFVNTATIAVVVSSNGSNANIALNSLVGAQNTVIYVQSNTLTSNANTFYLDFNVAGENYVSISKNGLVLTPNSHYYVVNANTIVLSTEALVNDTITFTYFLDIANVVDGNILSVAVAAYNQANAAYNAANNRVLKAGDTMTGNLNVAATLITQNIVPNLNVTYDLGTSTKRFKDLWLSNSTIYLGNTTISANGDKLVVPALELASGANLSNAVLKTGDTISGQLTIDTSGFALTANVADGNDAARFKSPTRTLAITPYYNSEGNDYGTWFEAFTTSGGSYSKMTLMGSDIILNSQGNTGIAVLSPTSKLHVSGNANITSGLVVDGSTFVVDATNNRVGVGTTTPASTLSVNGTVNATAIRAQSSASCTDITIYNDYGATRLIFSDAAGSYWIEKDSSENLLFKPNAVTAITFTAGGDISMTGQITNAGGINTNGLLANSATITLGPDSTDGFSSIVRIQSNTRTMRIYPYYNSEGSDRGTWFTVANTSGGTFSKFTLTATDIVLDARGNVGIGTTDPTANLHVTGTIKDTPIVSITGSATYADNAAGRVIFSNTTSAITVTIAAAATAGFSYTVIRGNTGNVTIANSGVTRLNSASISSLNIAQYGAATVVYTATNQVIVFGDFG